MKHTGYRTKDHIGVDDRPSITDAIGYGMCYRRTAVFYMVFHRFCERKITVDL